MNRAAFPLRLQRLAVLALSGVMFACGSSSESDAPGELASNSLTAQFDRLGAQLLLGDVELTDVVDFAEPLLLLERGESSPGVRGRTHVPLLVGGESFSVDLVAYPAVEESGGLSEFQLSATGRATSGTYQRNAVRRDIKVNFGFDSSNEPKFCSARVQDWIAVTPDSIERARSSVSRQIGGVYSAWSDRDPTWRPTVLRNIPETRSFEETADETATRSTETTRFFEYSYGTTNPGGAADLSLIVALRGRLDLEPKSASEQPPDSH